MDAPQFKIAVDTHRITCLELRYVHANGDGVHPERTVRKAPKRTEWLAGRCREVWISDDVLTVVIEEAQP